MRKLIETNESGTVECDNPNCDVVLKVEPDLLHEWINVACPNCGDNLLTHEDYKTYETLKKIIDWINKYFSWLTIFERKNNKRRKLYVKVHEGITVKDKDKK